MLPEKKNPLKMQPKDYREELAKEGAEVDPMAEYKGTSRKIADRESAYQARRLTRKLSPGPPAASNPEAYADAMSRADIEREVLSVEQEIMAECLEPPTPIMAAADDLTPPHPGHQHHKKQQNSQNNLTSHPVSGAAGPPEPRRSRWDKKLQPTPSTSEWDNDDDVPANKPGAHWEETPAVPETEKIVSGKRSRWDETPATSLSEASGAWDSTPAVPSTATAETPRAKRSRWDETPANLPAVSAALSMPTPTSSSLGTISIPLTPSASTEMEIRNQYTSDAELDLILPQEGYKILSPPASYVPIRTPVRKICATPTPYSGYLLPDDPGPHSAAGAVPGSAADHMLMHGTLGQAAQDLPSLKQEDIQFFGRLLEEKDEAKLSIDELKERKIMRLLLKIKNGTPPVRKAALRHITDKARELGPGPLFNQILPLLMSPSLEDQERHLLVKVIDRIMYKLDELVRPYVHKILVVIEPLLIDEDYYARVEGREIISNLAKAAGLATMIATMRPDIDHVDEYVRNTTARAFAVVACALGIPELLPFLKAVCRSRRSWQARHTGIKIIQQIALLMGCAVLPHLNNLVAALVDGIRDEHQKVRTMTALAIAALAEAAHPYGIESFDPILEPMFTDVSKHRGKSLAAFLKAIGSLIPLMDSIAAKEFTSVIVPTVIREFQSPDEEMKKIVLKVIKQCVGTDGVEPDYIKTEILTDFFRHFWVRRMALDKRNYKQLVETTVELAKNTGVACILTEIVAGLKDESEPFRKMVMDTADQIISAFGVADVDERLEQILIDGVLYAFQEQSSEEAIMLNGFGTIVNALGTRVRPYLQQICSTILWRLNNKSSKVRQQAADLISRVAVVLRTCGEEKLLSHLGVVLYEYLGEEYPEVLGSILGALKAIVNVIGMANMNPPIKDLLPRLTPILRNRHEKVQENVIDLVGRIADRGAEFVSAREWMRICFELLDMLKAHKKAIRRATVNTFGYIAKAIGPQDVLGTLLNNLKVQERQNRVCTTVAIAIVAETCSPFTVIPGLMCEYRVPELNVQNGVLKSLSFLFEYIGEMGRDYVYAVTPLLEDALVDRDLVHRQTACTTVKHLALGVAGLGCEDALLHLLNHLWPNIFETSPHVINAVCDGIDALRVALGCGILMNYILAGLFHPARRLREIYWKLYNAMYIGAQDSMVAYYPMIQPDARNRWTREELLYF